MSSVDDKNQDNEEKSIDQVDETQSNADKPEKELSELELAQKQADDNYELLLRAKAEVENIKKRTSKEVENAFKYSTESLLQEIIPIYDSLSLSCELSGDKTTKEQLDEGNKLLLSMFKQLFEKNNIQEINPKNEAFNPELHQAVSTIEDKKKKNDIVAEVVQKGYLLNKTTIFVGNSGSGKSTLTAALTGKKILSKALSNNQGVHTTSVSTLYHTDEMKIIDSPGVRDIGIDHLNSKEIILGFPEIINHSLLCAFPNCSHQIDEGCAVIAALKNGDIEERRYNNFIFLSNQEKSK